MLRSVGASPLANIKAVTDVGNRNEAARARLTNSRVAEINTEDLFEPTDASKNADPVVSHFKDVLNQKVADHEHRPHTHIFFQVIARILGLTFARCLSNTIAYFFGRAFFEARRDYAVLPKDAIIVNAKGEALKIDGKNITAEQLAERYKPRLFSINEDQATTDYLRPAEMRYEVLPPRLAKSDYSIVYYVRREREYMPIPILGFVTNFLRPILWATRSEWNAIEIDINRETGMPVALNYESSNYSADPFSYEMTSSNDVQLPTKAELRDKKWVHTLYQRDNKAKTRDIENPFTRDTHVGLTFVNWNGSLDIATAAQQLGYQLDAGPSSRTRLYSLDDVPLSFLDIDAYRNESLDLRNTWLNRRKTSRCYLSFAARKDAGDFQVINLALSQIPSLIEAPIV